MTDRALLDWVTSYAASEEDTAARLRQIRDDVLAHSAHVHQAGFTTIHPGDLEFLFDAYDQRCFGGRCRPALNGRPLRLRLSKRMTVAGGKTSRFTTRSGEVSFEIAIAISLLYNGFGVSGRRITVCGLECGDRLQALQRIFEHELVHLAEQLCWGTSNCTAPRFQDVARRLFLHRAHTHDLITWRERAAESAIRVGSPVGFEFEGLRFVGRVNRITKRATVLVEDPAGRSYTDGRSYRTYYVPISELRLI